MTRPPSSLRNVAIDRSSKLSTCHYRLENLRQRGTGRMTVSGGVAYIVTALLPVLALAAINAMVRAVGRRRGRPDTANEDS
ncbi:hypothetical protein MAUB_26590 [Mycolicibacterium aubagnense]|uniref:DUF4349 domain-containing protein n=1 Tax=Mycolicibacterium aubagnense TaxID=319707 RepID=A0ABN5YSS1_9MYCO|nr:hypothetical protein MAUB_26590 [Mycolicibacterium aubagnense]